jgi:hypothetical protein
MVFALLLMGLTSSAFSQSNFTYSVIYPGSPNTIRDTVIQQFKDDLKKNQVPNYGMPNAITVKPLPPVYRGNNGQGFDIYDSQIDNMAVLKPDSSFGSNMPVAKMPGIKQIPRVSVLPDNIIKQNDTIPATKFLDLLRRKQWQPKISPKK